MGYFIGWLVAAFLLFCMWADDWDSSSDKICKLILSFIIVGAITFVAFVTFSTPKGAKEKQEEKINPKEWDCGAKVGGECVVLYRKKEK